MRRLLLAAGAALLALGSPATEVPRRPVPVYVTRQQVTAAVQRVLTIPNREMSLVNEYQVEMPRVVVRGVAPVLKVEQLQFDSKKRVIYARLRCANRACLPFYANIVEVPGLEFDELTSSFHPDRRLDLRSRVVNSGDRAQLRVISPGLRLSMVVVCLQSGSVGDSIRVRDLKSGRILVGRVESEGILSAGR